MNTHAATVTNGILPLCGMAVFVILFLTIQASIKQNSLFQGRSAVAIAVCVSLLSVIGMHQTFFHASTDQDLTVGNGHPEINTLLIPYAALGIAILVMLLLMAITKLTGGAKTKKNAKEAINSESWYSCKREEKQIVFPGWPIKPQDKPRGKTSIRHVHHVQTQVNSDTIKTMKPMIKAWDTKGGKREDE